MAANVQQRSKAAPTKSDSDEAGHNGACSEIATAEASQQQTIDTSNLGLQQLIFVFVRSPKKTFRKITTIFLLPPTAKNSGQAAKQSKQN